MKKILLMMLLLASMASNAQERKYSTFYYQRATLFEELPVTSKDIIFLGNSITNGGEWSELLNNKHVKNRGISGDICMGVYDRLDAILKGKPAKIFLLIGINDVSRGTSADTIVNRIGMITQKIKQDSPKTIRELKAMNIKETVMLTGDKKEVGEYVAKKLNMDKVYTELFPVTDHYKMFGGHTSRWQEVKKINEGLMYLADKENVTYIDLYSHFVDEKTGKMNIEYTNDGLHLLGKGYLKWVDIVKPYINKK